MPKSTLEGVGKIQGQLRGSPRQHLTFNKELEIVLGDLLGTVGSLWDGACPWLWPQGVPTS